MTEEIIIDVSGCTHKRDDECMEVPIFNEYGDLMGYQSCEAQTLCPYRSQEKIKQLKEQRDKYYQQTLDDEITISDLIEEIQELKADRTLERISKLSIENARLEQENKEEKKVYNECMHYLACMTEQRNKLKIALEEIREIAEDAKEGRYTTKSEDYTEGMRIIGCYVLDKINEVTK